MKNEAEVPPPPPLIGQPDAGGRVCAHRAQHNNTGGLSVLTPSSRIQSHQELMTQTLVQNTLVLSQLKFSIKITNKSTFSIYLRICILYTMGQLIIGLATLD